MQAPLSRLRLLGMYWPWGALSRAFYRLLRYFRATTNPTSAEPISHTAAGTGIGFPPPPGGLGLLPLVFGPNCARSFAIALAQSFWFPGRQTDFVAVQAAQHVPEPVISELADAGIA